MSLKSWPDNKHHFGYYDKTVGVSDTYGVFSFASANPSAYTDSQNSFTEDGAWDLVAIEWTGLEPYNLPPFIKGLKNIKFMKPLIDCAPDFYILYHESQELEVDLLKRDYDKLPAWQKKALDSGWVPADKYVKSDYLENLAISSAPHRCARTLGELFKLMLEWEAVSKEPFNSTERVCAVACKILEVLEMPDDVKDELWQEYPDTHVARYLKGDMDAKNRPDGVPNITPLFDKWIEQKMLKYQFRGPLGNSARQ